MYLSIDIGGTKTLLALFSHRGSCHQQFKFNTSNSKDADTFLLELTQNLNHFIPPTLRSRILATTVAIPGIVKSSSNSYSFKFGNLSWQNPDITSAIKSVVNGDVFFVNDADLAALYESNYLNRKSPKTIYLTFSTGIGGGITKNGHLTPQSSEFEPGHVVYTFNHSKLEWEDIASANTLAKTYNSPLKDLSLNEKIISDIVSRVSLGLSDIIKVHDPKIIIIGGPLVFILNKIKKPLIDSLKNSLTAKTSLPKILKAHRPTESVIYGAYLYSKQNHR